MAKDRPLGENKIEPPRNKKWRWMIGGGGVMSIISGLVNAFFPDLPNPIWELLEGALTWGSELGGFALIIVLVVVIIIIIIWIANKQLSVEPKKSGRKRFGFSLFGKEIFSFFSETEMKTDSTDNKITKISDHPGFKKGS